MSELRANVLARLAHREVGDKGGEGFDDDSGFTGLSDWQVFQATVNHVNPRRTFVFPKHFAGKG